MRQSSKTSLGSWAAGLLGLAVIVFGLITAPAQKARAQTCTHVGATVNCPLGVVLGSTSLFFDADGNAVWPGGIITPGDYNVQPSNTGTGQGLYNLNTGLGQFSVGFDACALNSACAQATNRRGDFTMSVNPFSEDRTYWYSQLPEPVLLESNPLYNPLSARSYYIGTTHTVASGENLFRIARRYGVSATAIRVANSIPAGAKLSSGQMLRIPGRPGSAGGGNNNTDCGVTNSCGNDFFKPPPVTFGDCNDGGCDQTGPTTPNATGSNYPQLRIRIWDTSDHIYDSIVLLDNWQWNPALSSPGMIID